MGRTVFEGTTSEVTQHLREERQVLARVGEHPADERVGGERRNQGGGGQRSLVGGPLCHAAIVAREFGIPAVVGALDATALQSGTMVEVDPVKGVVRPL